MSWRRNQLRNKSQQKGPRAEKAEMRLVRWSGERFGESQGREGVSTPGKRRGKPLACPIGKAGSSLLRAYFW